MFIIFLLHRFEGSRPKFGITQEILWILLADLEFQKHAYSEIFTLAAQKHWEPDVWVQNTLYSKLTYFVFSSCLLTQSRTCSCVCFFVKSWLWRMAWSSFFWVSLRSLNKPIKHKILQYLLACTYLQGEPRQHRTTRAGQGRWSAFWDAFQWTISRLKPN